MIRIIIQPRNGHYWSSKWYNNIPTMMFLGQKQLVTSSFVEQQKSQHSRPICQIRFRHILPIASTSTVIGIIEFTQAKILFHANSFTAAADLLRSSEESITVSSKDAIRNNIACIEAKRGKFNLSQHLLQQASVSCQDAIIRLFVAYIFPQESFTLLYAVCWFIVPIWSCESSSDYSI